jgi:hypothetical protein
VTLPQPRDMSHLLRLVRGDVVPEGLDDELGESAREYARVLRSATNGVAPVEKLAQVPGGAEVARALLAAGEKDSAGPIGIEVPAETIFQWRTAREIAQTTPARATWLWQGYLAKGAITECDAKIKAGKTELVARLIKALLTGEDFLERPTRKTPVVYLTEQTPTTFREPLRRAGLLETDDLVVLSWHDTIGHSWADVAAAAVAKCHEIGAELIVVDTLSAFARLGGDDENSSGKAAEAMAPLQIAAGTGLAVLVLRHDRKSGGDVGESARGSSAFGGAVDIILALRRGEGASRPTVRALHGLSRFDETPTQLMIELTDAGYVALGTQTAVAAKEARIAILDNAPQTLEHALTEQELLDRAEVKRSTARPALAELVANGALQTVGEGKRGDPKRYWRADGPRNLSDGTTGVSTESFSGAPTALGGTRAPASEIVSAGTSISIDPAETFLADDDDEDLPW